ncbi:aldehyde ferredoxin oxidoreductase C-terminal domain-containing protein [Catellatospora sp. NPDC049609]|uniref:aldehyde ferredoxin oxidoreductase C-terminal domain-containing protein n=1 Tax=Catellatospora sp. NPDC049609 TaxID=3155505 RepID=UPI00343F2C6C
MTHLHVDLDTGGQSPEPVVGWGGPMQALATLRRALPTAVGPADHRLPVALVTGTVAGLGAVATARCAAVGVSPLSGAAGLLVELVERAAQPGHPLGLSVPAPASTLDVARTLRLADLWSGLDALLICPYASTPTRPLTLDRVCELVGATSGRPVTPERLFALGRARLRAQQALNDLLRVAPGTLPDRFFDEPVAAGAHPGAVLDRALFTAATRVTTTGRDPRRDTVAGRVVARSPAGWSPGGPWRGRRAGRVRIAARPLRESRMIWIGRRNTPDRTAAIGRIHASGPRRCLGLLHGSYRP